jgi:hypothetical protein
MSTPMQIGFSQRVQLEWLEQTAALVLAGQTREQVETTLQERLHEYLAPSGRTLLISDVPDASPMVSSHPQVCQR